MTIPKALRVHLFFILLMTTASLGAQTQESSMDMRAIETFFNQFGHALSKSDFEQAKELAETYTASEHFHSHVGLAIAENLTRHAKLLDLAEKVIKRSIRENTLELLAKLSPGMGNENYQKVEFGRLYSQYAWILWKQQKPAEALNTMQKATDYFKQTGGPTADDCIRLGIILYGNSEADLGWQQVTRALLMDTQIETQDPGYMAAIEDFVHARHGRDTNTRGFLTQYRYQHAEPVPDTTFLTLDGDRLRLDRQQGKVLFINFFSPLCGSCRQEISSLAELYDDLITRHDSALYLILNQPGMTREAVEMLTNAGLQNPNILTVEEGSAYDLISEEPSIWIVDKSGKIVSKHTGYQPGDESIYHQELTQLLE